MVQDSTIQAEVSLPTASENLVGYPARPDKQGQEIEPSPTVEPVDPGEFPLPAGSRTHSTGIPEPAQSTPITHGSVFTGYPKVFTCIKLNLIKLQAAVVLPYLRICSGRTILQWWLMLISARS